LFFPKRLLNSACRRSGPARLRYQLYACGNFLSRPWFWKKLLFPDSLL